MITLTTLLAEAEPIGGDLGKLGGYSPDINDGKVTNYTQNFGAFASNILGFLSVLAGIMFLLYFMLGAISWITAGGDEGKVEKARNQMSNAAIGLIIVALAFSVSYIVGTVTGINILNPGEVIEKLVPGGSSPEGIMDNPTKTGIQQ